MERPETSFDEAFLDELIAIQDAKDTIYQRILMKLITEGVSVAGAKEQAIAIVERKLGLREGSYCPTRNLQDTSSEEDHGVF